VSGHTATIVISDPARRNALTPAMWRRLPALLDEAAAKETIDLAVAGRPSAEREAFWQAEMHRAGEAVEGVAAFLDRRPATFTWNP